MLRAVDVMSRSVVAVGRDMTVRDAAKLMSEEGVGSLIITDNNQPIGIVTETNFTRQVTAKGLPGTTPLEEIMSSPLYHSNADADIIEVANAMTTNRVKKIPIIDGGRIIGIVTQTDIISHIFRAVRSLERSHEQGKITTQQYAEKFSSLFRDFQPAIAGLERNWYMRCQVCNHTFMNPEKDGIMRITKCPRCGSPELQYDPSPAV